MLDTHRYVGRWSIVASRSPRPVVLSDAQHHLVLAAIHQKCRRPQPLTNASTAWCCLSEVFTRLRVVPEGVPSNLEMLSRLVLMMPPETASSSALFNKDTSLLIVPLRVVALCAVDLERVCGATILPTVARVTLMIGGPHDREPRAPVASGFRFGRRPASTAQRACSTSPRRRLCP